MTVHTWDEISDEWATHELPIDSTDPVEINRILGSLLANDEEGDGYEVVSSSQTGPILTIETRDDHNHFAIVIAIIE